MSESPSQSSLHPNDGAFNRASRVLVIGCGAIAHELVELLRINAWSHIDVQCLPADWHNTPAKIPQAISEKIEAQHHNYAKVFVAYADCGTGGLLDAVINKWSQHLPVERIPGDHCYEFFAGRDVFTHLQEQELGTFYLTDYLARNFQRIIIGGLKIDQYPQLKAMYFANYTRLVYLAQTDDEQLNQLAQHAAHDLGLRYERHYTGLNPLNTIVVKPLSIDTSQ